MTENEWFPNLENSENTKRWFQDKSKNSKFKLIIGLFDELALILIPIMGLYYFFIR
ncbi:MAG: hypothetical protein ACXAB7_10250 [Candidatus Kariarchaeaceae archaeon]|jgi:hypothetical protein